MPVGYTSGAFDDPERLDWDHKDPRPLRWVAWYPTAGPEVEATVPEAGLFHCDPVVHDAPPHPGPLPVVLMSHGTGGAPHGQGWLAHALAQAGYFVIAPYHHGNTGIEPYRAEGFLCWWERAADLTQVLDTFAAEGPFSDGINTGSVAVVGFSLGAYTALSIAGAVTDMEQFARFRARGDALKPPPEFPDLEAQIPELMKTSQAFRLSWERQSHLFKDDRVTNVVAIAAPPPVRGFLTESLAALTLPVTILSGGADDQAPPEHCGAWLQEANPRFQHISMGAEVGHYTFLGMAAGTVPEPVQFLFDDRDGVDRAEVHRATIEAVQSALHR